MSKSEGPIPPIRKDIEVIPADDSSKLRLKFKGYTIGAITMFNSKGIKRFTLKRTYSRIIGKTFYKKTHGIDLDGLPATITIKDRCKTGRGLLVYTYTPFDFITYACLRRNYAEI